MDKQDKEIHDAIQAKFGTNKTGDETFSEKTYWGSVPVGEDGEPHEIPRSNPDVLPESAGKWFTELTEGQRDKLDAIATAPLSPQERRTVELFGEGLLFRQVAEKMGVSISAVQSFLERAQRKIKKTLAVKSGSHEQ